MKLPAKTARETRWHSGPNSELEEWPVGLFVMVHDLDDIEDESVRRSFKEIKGRKPKIVIGWCRGGFRAFDREDLVLLRG